MITGNDPLFNQIVQQAKTIATSPCPVLIQGESGTGKDVLAMYIHQNSPRHTYPCVVVNCAAIHDTLLESEMFGHTKGSFSGAVLTRKGKFEIANNSTMFLDEIGDMSLQAQAKLLRVIETGMFEKLGSNTTQSANVRFICATNKNLHQEIKKGNFREDLLFRINTLQFTIPPLRTRKDDIPVFFNYYLNQMYSKYNKTVHIEESVIRYLQTYHWPGNIRELKSQVERAVLLCPPDQPITPNMFNLAQNDEHILSQSTDLFTYIQQQFSSLNISLPKFTDNLHKVIITHTMQNNDLRVKKTADVLGMTARQVRYTMDRTGISYLIPPERINVNSGRKKHKTT